MINKICRICAQPFTTTQHRHMTCSDKCYVLHKTEKIPDDPNGCWIWVGQTTKGYGRATRHGTQILVHRLSYEAFTGPIPSDLILRHSCHSRRCMNPRHLSPGTPQNNMDDMKEAGRTARGDRNARAKLTEEQVTEILRSPETQTALGRKYGISQVHIGRIKNRDSWKYLTH